jgi:cytochrome c2
MNKITLICVIKTKGDFMRKGLSLFLLVGILFSVEAFAAGNAKKIADGKFLYEDWGCKGCHAIGNLYPQESDSGPDLKGVFKRRSADWVKKFTKNPQAMIDSGDKDAVEMHKKYGKVMKTFKITDAEWGDIFEFIKSESGK